jgi:hypothetical protein
MWRQRNAIVHICVPDSARVNQIGQQRIMYNTHLAAYASHLTQILG